MKKLEDAIQNVKEGCVLTINKYKEDLYSSCLVLYDGLVFKDVKEVELGNFINNIPNIKRELDNNLIYKVSYLFEEQKYQSTIIRYVREGGYKEKPQEEIVDDYLVISDSFLDSIMELDTKLAHKDKNTKKVKQKVIA